MLVSWIFLIPETYAPTLLGRRTEGLRAEAAAAGTGEVFISKYEKGGKKPLAQVIKVGLGRPFALLFKEVIVWPLSLYCEIHFAQSCERVLILFSGCGVWDSLSPLYGVSRDFRGIERMVS